MNAPSAADFVTLTFFFSSLHRSAESAWVSVCSPYRPVYYRGRSLESKATERKAREDFRQQLAPTIRSMNEARSPQSMQQQQRYDSWSPGIALCTGTVISCGADLYPRILSFPHSPSFLCFYKPVLKSLYTKKKFTNSKIQSLASSPTANTVNSFYIYFFFHVEFSMRFRIALVIAFFSRVCTT